MSETILTEHFGRHITLTTTERSALAELTTASRHYRRGSILRAEHGEAGEILVVRSGWIFCSALLEDGRRQIIRLHFRGDLLGLDSLAFDEAPDTVTALTDTEVCVVDRAALQRIFVRHARLAALFFACQQVDRVTLIDRLVSLGRNSARGRVAALLLWMAARLRSAGEDPDAGFALPTTQEEVGDMTGLTAVHVNRTMRVLVDQGYIRRTGAILRILDADRLARIANYVERDYRPDLSWLPPAA